MKKEKMILTSEQREEYLLRMFSILKMMENISLVDRKNCLNNSELRMLGEIFSANRNGKRLISTQLADRLNLTRSAISQMVNKLEKEGIVNRIPDEVDRKIAYIELSEIAYEKYVRAKEMASEELGEIISSFGVAKFEKLCDLSESFAKTVEKHKAKSKKK